MLAQLWPNPCDVAPLSTVKTRIKETAEILITSRLKFDQFEQLLKLRPKCALRAIGNTQLSTKSGVQQNI